jgi:hypothetical protein
MAQRQLTQKEWNQADDLSDELMTLMVSKGTIGMVGLVAVTFLVAKTLLSLSKNNEAEAHTTLDNTVVPNIKLAIDEMEIRDVRH